jgi:hypothetical protein
VGPVKLWGLGTGINFLVTSAFVYLCRDKVVAEKDEARRTSSDVHAESKQQEEQCDPVPVGS